MTEAPKKKKPGIKYYLNAPLKDSYTYSEFYKEYWNQIYANAYRYCRHRQDAEDVTQEIMLRVYTRWSTLEQETLTAGVSRYATQGHIDWLRVVLRRKADMRSLDDVYDPSYDFNHPEDTFANPYYEILRDTASSCLEDTFEMQGQLDKRLFLMVYDEGIRTVDAAKALDISKGNADIRLHRARKLLSTCFTKDELLDEVTGVLGK